ncbi:MAG: hypothetical protein LBI42_11305 [Chitinispirillales bacterium]|nr:hypothetical protein [Chitinispirillales bacterium]
MNKPKELIFNKIELQIIFGFDLGHILLNNEQKNTFNSFRGSKKWLKDLKEKIETTKQNYIFQNPEFASSSYSSTDRRERSTFSIYYDKTLMPLSFSINDDNPLHLTEHNISVKFQKIKLGINGSVTLTSRLSYQSSGLSFNNFIEIYNNKINIIKEKAHSIVVKLIEMLGSNLTVQFNNQIRFEKFNQFVDCFEVMDFDYTIYNNKKMLIHDLYKDDDFLRQLARLFRMSLSNYKNHDIDRIKKLLKDDIGYRKDELWLINRNRVIRHFPKAEDEFQKRFFNDIVLGCEIFIQHKVALLYLNQWCIHKYSEIKEIIEGGKYLIPQEFNKLEKIIFEMTNFINIFSDDFYVQMNIKHSFFNEFMEQLLIKLDLILILKSNRYLLSSLLERLSSISSIITTKRSIELDTLNYNLSRSVKGINITVIIFTILMVLIATSQLIVAVMQYMK